MNDSPDKFIKEEEEQNISLQSELVTILIYYFC
jgi:hypothetical protein